MRFQERLQLAFARERARRKGLGQPLLTKTDLWKAAGLSSGAVSHWFRGGNDADLASCIKVAPLLRCDPWWLYDGSGPAPGAPVPQPTPTPSPPLLAPEIAAIVELLQRLCPAQRGEVLGYARRVLDEAGKDPVKANAVR